jgi:cell division protein FtsI (penicillin-binding protein 3)
MSRGFASNHRVTGLAAVVLLGFTAVAAQLFNLHVVGRTARLRDVNRVRRELVVESSRRGDILDDHGDALATSRTQVALAIDPWALADALQALDTAHKPKLRARLLQAEQAKHAVLAAQLGMDAGVLEKFYTPVTRDPRPDDDQRSIMADGKVKVRFVKFHDGVEESLYACLMDPKRYPQADPKAAPTPPLGLVGQRYSVRIYPHGQLAAHVVGFVNQQSQPVTGVERFADFYLRGADGWRESEKDGRQRELEQFRTREAPPRDGYAVVLSLDAAVQHMAEQELADVAAKFQPQKATIIVSDARTGFILALANWPTFDPNHFNAPGPAGPRAERNIAVADFLEPGSTFKIVAASGALEEHLVTPATEFDVSQDKVEYKGLPRALPRDDHPFTRPISVAEIIEHSSNRGAAQLGMQLGEERLWTYARAFGFGELTGFPDIYPETPGMLANWTKWSGSDITRIPMGHTIAASPLQIHMAMAVIAGGGELLRPQLVREVRDPAGVVVYHFDRDARRRVIGAATARTMAGLLTGVVSAEGTAPEAAIPGFDAAGKTGTTEKLIDGKYSTTHHVASFVGFFPAGDPAVVISVIVDDGHPPGGGTAYGRLVAAPSFKHLGEQLIPYLDIKPVAAPAGPGSSLLALQGGRP